MTPSERVRAFIDDWHAAWSSQDQTGDVDFDAWGARVAEVDARHFVAGAGSGSAGSFSSQPSHAAEEQFDDVGETGDTAYVESRLASDLPTYYRYDLRRVDGDWRIAALWTFLVERDEPALPADERAALLARPRLDAVLPPLPHDQHPDGTRLFEHGRTVTRHGETTTTDVRRIATLKVPSGMLGIRDLGYDLHGFEPLDRAVAPGSYPVDIVVAFDRVAAVRVVLDEAAPVVAWHPATAGAGHAFGVDAGNLGIFDAGAQTALRAREREQLFAVHVAQSEEYPLAHAATDTCVVVGSGVGDGVYPAFWGVDAGGRPVVLVVDFLLLVDQIVEREVVRWTPRGGPVVAAGIRIDIRPSNVSLFVTVIEVHGRVAELHLRDLAGNELVRADHLGGTVADGVCRYNWNQMFGELEALDLDVVVYRGYRN